MASDYYLKELYLRCLEQPWKRLYSWYYPKFLQCFLICKWYIRKRSSSFVFVENSIYNVKNIFYFSKKSLFQVKFLSVTKIYPPTHRLAFVWRQAWEEPIRLTPSCNFLNLLLNLRILNVSIPQKHVGLWY